MTSKLDIKLDIDQSEFINGMRQATKVADRFATETQQGLREVGKGFTIARGAVATFIGAFAVEAVQRGLSTLINGIGGVVNAAANIETVVNQFTTLTGSVELAEQHVRDLQQFATKTPFQLQGLAESSKVLQSFGFETEKIIPILTNLGDIAAVSGNDVKDLAVIFGQVRAAGKLTGERLLQLQERGIPVLKELANNFGTTEAAVRDMVSKGQVDFDSFADSLGGLTKEGAQFFNGMATLSETFSGKLSTLGDNFEALSAAAGESLLPIAKNLIDLALKILPSVTDAVGTFMQNSLPAFQVLSDLVVILTNDIKTTGEAFGGAGAIGTTFSDVILSIGKGVIFTQTGFKALFGLIRAGTAAAVLPLVASLRALASGINLLPTVDLSKQIASLDNDMAELSQEVTGLGGRLGELGQKQQRSLQYMIDQNLKTRQLLEEKKQLANITAALSAEEAKGANANQSTIESLREYQNELKLTIENRRESINTAALESLAVQEAEQIKTAAIKQTADSTAESKTNLFNLEEELKNATLENDKARREEDLLSQEVKNNSEFELLKKGLGEREAAKVLAEATRLANEKKANEASILLQKSLVEAQTNIDKEKADTDKKRKDDELKQEKERLREEQKEREKQRVEIAKAEEEYLAEKARQEQGSLNLFKRIKQSELAFERMTQVEKMNAVSNGLSTITGLMRTESGAAFQIGKAAAIANATVQTYQSAVSAYASLAPIPYVGVALGTAAAAAAITAGFANIRSIKNQQPRFQTGGIVGGSSFTGDSVPARLNSGELVLTRNQQQNLFSMIKSGGGDRLSDNIGERLMKLEQAILSQPVIVQVDSQEIARAVRDGKQSGI